MLSADLHNELEVSNIRLLSLQQFLQHPPEWQTTIYGNSRSPIPKSLTAGVRGMRHFLTLSFSGVVFPGLFRSRSAPVLHDAAPGHPDSVQSHASSSPCSAQSDWTGQSKHCCVESFQSPSPVCVCAHVHSQGSWTTLVRELTIQLLLSSTKH